MTLIQDDLEKLDKVKNGEIEADIVIPTDKIKKVTHVELRSGKHELDSQFNEKELIDIYDAALGRAAEEAYQREMLDTNMAILEIKEVAEKYNFYSSKEERRHALENCGWETKEQWIETLIDLWLSPENPEDPEDMER